MGFHVRTKMVSNVHINAYQGMFGVWTIKKGSYTPFYRGSQVLAGSCGPSFQQMFGSSVDLEKLYLNLPGNIILPITIYLFKTYT